MTETLERAAQQSGSTSPIKIKKLGHVVFTVADVERSVKFYTEVLNFRVSDVNENGMVFFTACGDHHTIAIAPAAAGMDAKQVEKGQLGLSHFAMEVETLDELFEIRDFLKGKGLLISEGRRGPGGNTEVHLLDPDGYNLEFYWKMDQIGPGEASRPSSQWHRVNSLEEARDNPLP
jgi:catechol 2,3-dioxygenase-like lactoylglutathione lyase family enzyme